LIPLRTLSCGSESSSEKQEKKKKSSNIRTNHNVFGFDEDTAMIDDFNYISSQSIVPVKSTKKNKKKIEKSKNTNRIDVKSAEPSTSLLVKSNS